MSEKTQETDKVVAVFAADLHVSEHIWASYPELRDDSFFALEQVVDIALKFEAPLVLAGDVLELMRTVTPTSRTVQFVNSTIERMRSEGTAPLPVYYIHGQHDLAQPSWLSSINPWARDLSLRKVTIADKQWMGIGWQDPESLAHWIEAIDDDVYGLVMHQRWQEFEGGSSADGSLADLVAAKPNVRVIVTGDLHKHGSKQIGKCLCISPGATHKRTVKEPDEHCVVLLTERGRLRRYFLKTRLINNVKIASQEALNSVIARLPARVAEQTQQSLDNGVWPSVSVPLLLVEDVAGIGAAAQIREAMGGLAHVMSRAVQVEDYNIISAEELAFVETAQAAEMRSVQTDKLMDIAQSELVHNFGPQAPQVALAMGVMQGRSLSDLRAEYLQAAIS